MTKTKRIRFIITSPSIGAFGIYILFCETCVFQLHANATRFSCSCDLFFPLLNKVTKQQRPVAQDPCPIQVQAPSGGWPLHGNAMRQIYLNSIQLKHFPAAPMGCNQIQNPTEAPPNRCAGSQATPRWGVHTRGSWAEPSLTAEHSVLLTRSTSFLSSFFNSHSQVMISLGPMGGFDCVALGEEDPPQPSSCQNVWQSPSEKKI